MRWIKKQLVSNLTLLTPKFPRYVTNATESIPQNGAHIFRKIVKTTKMRGFGQPSFLMQIFFRIFRMDFFFVSKRAEWVRVRETEYLLIFACHFPASIQHQGQLWPHKGPKDHGRKRRRLCPAVAWRKLLTFEVLKLNSTKIFFSLRNRFEITSHLGQGMPESFRSLGTEVASTTRSVSA